MNLEINRIKILNSDLSEEQIELLKYALDDVQINNVKFSNPPSITFDSDSLRGGCCSYEDNNHVLISKCFKLESPSITSDIRWAYARNIVDTYLHESAHSLLQTIQKQRNLEQGVTKYDMSSHSIAFGALLYLMYSRAGVQKDSGGGLGRQYTTMLSIYDIHESMFPHVPVHDAIISPSEIFRFTQTMSVECYKIESIEDCALHIYNRALEVIEQMREGVFEHLDLSSYMQCLNILEDTHKEELKCKDDEIALLKQVIRKSSKKVSTLQAQVDEDQKFRNYFHYAALGLVSVSPWLFMGAARAFF